MAFVLDPSSTSRARRAFTLTEIVVVIGVVGILGAITAYSFTSLRGRRSAHDAARAIVAEIHRVRTVALAGRLGPGGGPSFGGGGGGTFNASLSGASDSYLTTGVEILDDRTLVFFGDPDRLNDGDETTLSVIELDERFAEGDVRVSAPAVGSVIRFERNSTRDPGSPGQIDLTDDNTGLTTSVRITVAGVPRVL